MIFLIFFISVLVIDSSTAGKLQIQTFIHNKKNGFIVQMFSKF